MSIVIVFIVLALQRIAVTDVYSYQLAWLQAYFRWLEKKIEFLTEEHALVTVLLLILPLIIVVILVFSLIYHFLGIFVYAIFNFILLWFCMDGRDLLRRPYLGASVADLFKLTFERLFAVIFWFVIFGPAGLILYTAVISLRNYLVSADNPHTLYYTLKIKAILDWLPIRLLGLSYAIVGNFTAVSKIWMQHWREGLESDAHLTVEYGSTALDISESALSGAGIEVIQIINRCLVFWILVLGLLSAAYWLG